MIKKYIFKIFLTSILVIYSNQSLASTIFDTLNSAFLKNVKLNAERASMRASVAEKKEAVSEFLPSITISGYVSEQDNSGSAGNSFFKPTYNLL